jgi:hypothetical protein
MANRRTVKKDINNVLADVIEECYLFMMNHPGKNEQETESIIDSAVDLADDLMLRVNNLKGIKAGKEMKSHFQKILDELEEKAVEFITRLNQLEAKTK